MSKQEDRNIRPQEGPIQPSQVDNDPRHPGNIKGQVLGDRTLGPGPRIMFSTEWIEALVKCNQETGGHPVLPEGSKADIVEKLKHLLADQDYLRNYLDSLATSARRFDSDRQSHGEPLSPDRQKAAFGWRGRNAR